MRDSWKEKLIKWFTLTLVAVVFISGLLLAWPNYRRGQALKKQDAEFSSRIEAKRREIARLLDNQRRFRTDPDFVEHIARQNRRVFPGELVFVFKER